MNDNYFIADQFSLLSRLMDIHGENAFKSKSYGIAAFSIEKLPVQLRDLQPQEIFALKGIGESTGKKILEILKTGKLAALEETIAITPEGVVEMLQIKGLGPKKIHTVWKEMQLESLGELLYACQENRLLLYKGFGAKTQANVMEAIEFYMSNRHQYLYAEVESFVNALNDRLQKAFPENLIRVAGDFRRQNETLEQVEWVTTVPENELTAFLQTEDILPLPANPPVSTYTGPGNIPMAFHHTEIKAFNKFLFEHSCSAEFLDAWLQKFSLTDTDSEEAIFSSNGFPYILPCMREFSSILYDSERVPGTVIQPADVRGVIHTHSNWSDGSHSVEEMTIACMQQGFEYLVISDHSKSAFYANGLGEERISEQHRMIDELNKKYHPFRIFKSIECDILNDGSLDYSDSILSTFDLVIVSVHSNLKMTEEKAMSRLLRAIENPYTTILGHMTGRLLLSRNGYPVQYDIIIDACKANSVAIELNAHPRRLDIDWRQIHRAMEKNVLISIDPDAHSTEGFKDIRYGVLSAQKAGLMPEGNLSSFSRDAFADYLGNLKK